MEKGRGESMAQARKKRQFPGNGGFTLSEMLAAVAVLTLMLALSLPALGELRREIRQKELDSKAEILYVAAQNRLSKLRAAHREEDYAYAPGSGNGVAPLDYTPGDAGEDFRGEGLCYVSSLTGGGAAAALLPEGAADAQLLGKYWLVEYIPGSGSVYAVFYSEESVDWDTEQGRTALDSLRRRDERLSAGAKVGYYGGDAVGVEEVRALEPEITVENGEKLTVRFACPRPRGGEDAAGLTFYITLSDDGGQSWESGALTLADMDDVGSVYRYTMVLDDLSSRESRFHAQFPRLSAGTGLHITLRVTCKDPLVEEKSVTADTNGLFADGSAPGEAVIRCARHLQNLDESSGVSASVTAAVQRQDISFYDDPGRRDDWMDCYGGKYYFFETGDGSYAAPGGGRFAPIHNPNLRSYTGSYENGASPVYTAIYGLTTVDGQESAGLFGVVDGPMTFRDIRLSGLRAMAASAAGALAGRVEAAVEAEGCMVFLSAEKGETAAGDSRLSGGDCGGLFGVVSASGSAAVSRSFAATVLSANSGCAGGLVGRSEGTLTLRSSYADCYLSGRFVGGLVGSGRAEAEDCYAAGYLRAAKEDNGSAAGLVGGSAVLRRCYSCCCFTGDAPAFSTAAGGSAADTYYLFDGLPAGVSHLPAAVGCDYGFLSDRETMAGRLGGAFTAATRNSTRPYNLLGQSLGDYVFPRLGTLPHYGDWGVRQETGQMGIFYWELEEGGANAGYHFSLLSENGETLSELCTAHDDGGCITRYGYGYFVRGGIGQDRVKFTAQNCTLGSRNAAAEEALRSRFPQLTAVAYTTGADGGKDALRPKGNYVNCNWTLTYRNEGGKNTRYAYALSPFFANAMGCAGAEGGEPGSGARPYEIRSVEQLRCINWNWKNADTVTWVGGGSYRDFPYLAQTTVRGAAVQRREDVTTGKHSWRQTHDLCGAAVTDYVPIAAQGVSSGAKGQDALLYGWFGGSYDGGGYLIRDLSIASSAFSVGLFGTACGARIENVVLYSERNSRIERPGGSPAGAYALGGLVGVATDYAEGSGGLVSNCAVAGYRIADNSTNALTPGGSSVGGLAGVANVEVQRCTAVTELEINATHPAAAAGENCLRVGGLCGGAGGHISGCYTGGSIAVGAATLAETRDGSGQNVAPGAAASRERSTHLYLGGVCGGAFAANYRNLSGGAPAQAAPVLRNCYTYMDLPRWEGAIRAVSAIASLGDGYASGSSLAVQNCCYLDSIRQGVELPEEQYSFGGTPIPAAEAENIFRGDLTALGAYFPGTGTASHASLDVTALRYGQMSDGVTLPGKLGGVFGSVSGGATPGRYSYPGAARELAGLDYPFAAALTRQEGAGVVRVHYGRWSVPGLGWDEGTAEIDLLRDMIVDENDPHCGWAVRELTLSCRGGKAPVGSELHFFYDGADSSPLAECRQLSYDAESGVYRVLVIAKGSGAVTLAASDGSSRCECTLEITARLNVAAVPALLRLNIGIEGEGESVGVSLSAFSGVRGDGSVLDVTDGCVWTVTESGEGLVSCTQPVRGGFTVSGRGVGSTQLRVECRFDYHGVTVDGGAFVQVECVSSETPEEGGAVPAEPVFLIRFYGEEGGGELEALRICRTADAERTLVALPVLPDDLLREHSRFLGWSEGAAWLYRAGEEFTAELSMEEHCLTALWEDELLLGFDTLCETVPPAARYVRPGETTELPGCAREGYVLRGWNDGTGVYAPNSSYTAQRNVTFTAEWSPLGTGEEENGTA